MNWPLLSLHPHLPFLSLPAYSPSKPYSIPGTYQAASRFWIILSTRPLCLDRDVGQMPCKSVFPWSPDIMPKLSKHPSPAPPSSSHNSLSRGSAGLAKMPKFLFPGWTLLTDWVSIICLPEGQEEKREAGTISYRGPARSCHEPHKKQGSIMM